MNFWYAPDELPLDDLLIVAQHMIDKPFIQMIQILLPDLLLEFVISELQPILCLEVMVHERVDGLGTVPELIIDLWYHVVQPESFVVMAV